MCNDHHNIRMTIYHKQINFTLLELFPSIYMLSYLDFSNIDNKWFSIMCTSTGSRTDCNVNLTHTTASNLITAQDEVAKRKKQHLLFIEPKEEWCYCY